MKDNFLEVAPEIVLLFSTEAIEPINARMVLLGEHTAPHRVTDVVLGGLGCVHIDCFAKRHIKVSRSLRVIM